MSDLVFEPSELSPAELRGAYLECLLAPDARGARAVIADARAAGVPAAVLYLDVIAPAMHEVGRRWELARVSVAQEHLATQITRAVIGTLAIEIDATTRVGRGRTAVVASSPGELHALGVQMVCDFLEAQGWEVHNLGPDAPVRDIVAVVRDSRAEVVALSTALSRHLLSVTQTCQRLRKLEPPPFIVAGGRAYHGNRRQALAVGADAFCEDPSELLELLVGRFGADAAD